MRRRWAWGLLTGLVACSTGALLVPSNVDSGAVDAGPDVGTIDAGNFDFDGFPKDCRADDECEIVESRVQCAFCCTTPWAVRRGSYDAALTDYEELCKRSNGVGVGTCPGLFCGWRGAICEAGVCGIAW